MFRVYPYAAEQEPTIYDKINISIIMHEVENISRSTDNLDEFGKRTLKQGKEILDIGAKCIYVLSWYLDNPDWKVRFWIVDIMGYLKNMEAERPLSRVIDNPDEEKTVKDRALKSLKKLGIN